MNRFTKLSHEGVALPDDAALADLGGIRVNATGVIVLPQVLNDGKTVQQPEAVQLGNARGPALCGLTWRAPEIEDLFHIPDRRRTDPALDPVFWQFLIDAYKGGENWRAWSATPSAADPAVNPWSLYLYDGAANISNQSFRGLALAVCGPVASAGQ